MILRLIKIFTFIKRENQVKKLIILWQLQKRNLTKSVKTARANRIKRSNVFITYKRFEIALGRESRKPLTKLYYLSGLRSSTCVFGTHGTGKINMLPIIAQ